MTKLYSRGMMLVMATSNSMIVYSDYIIDNLILPHNIVHIVILRTWILVCTDSDIHLVKSDINGHRIYHTLPIRFNRYCAYGNSVIAITLSPYIIEDDCGILRVSSFQDDVVDVLAKDVFDLSNGLCYVTNGYLLWNDVIYSVSNKIDVAAIVTDTDSCMLVSSDRLLYGVGSNSYNKLGIAGEDKLTNITLIEDLKQVKRLLYYSSATIAVCYNGMYITGLFIHKHYQCYTKISE